MIKINRRNLLVGMGLSGVSAAMSSRFSVAQCKKHLKILILGGTGFRLNQPPGDSVCAREIVENFVA
jgi:hypothetical protein